jgi:hypothetical protein
MRIDNPEIQGTTSGIVTSASYAITASYAINGGGGGNTTVTISGSTPSTSSVSGSLWWNDNDGNLYIQTRTPTGSVWVPAVSSVAGGDYGATRTFTQTGSVWSLNHNLNTTSPIVQVYSGSSVIIPVSIDIVNANNITVTFSQTSSGTAVVSTGIGGPTSSSFAITSVTSTSSSFASTATSSSFATTSISSSFAQTASFIATSSFANQAGTYAIPDTFNSSSLWVNLGTWNTSQNGETLYIRIVGHAGYNASSDSNQVTELHFKTKHFKQDYQATMH